MPNIVGYGICGPGEADKYLEQSLKEFERLCDDVIILLNNATQKEVELIDKYGFKTVTDNREWGKLQWKIKEDFVSKHVAQLKPDLCVCIDMDEVFDKHLTKEKLVEMYNQPWEAFYFLIVNLWDSGYNKTRNFWNIRAWKWKPEFGFQWPRKNVHCGLGPEWTWARAYYSPYILKHYGLKEKSVRDAKVKRYEKYDPKAQFITPEYYHSIASEYVADEFDEEKLHQEVVDFVIKTNQKYYYRPMNEEQQIAYIELKQNGTIVAVPKKKIDDYVKQGHKYVGDHEQIEKDLDDILNDPIDDPVEEPSVATEYTCDKCDFSTDNKRKLQGHKIGAHKNAK